MSCHSQLMFTTNNNEVVNEKNTDIMPENLTNLDCNGNEGVSIILILITGCLMWKEMNNFILQVEYKLQHLFTYEF